MTVRPFDWRDLSVLHRYRHQGLFFDSTLVLTRGVMLIPAGALLSYLGPGIGIFTYLCVDNENDTQPLIGQVMHASGSTSAHLSFLAPESVLASVDMSELLDQMAVQIGARGAYHILADVDEHQVAFEALHKSGFAICARQRIWQMAGEPLGEAHPTPWRACNDSDLIGVRSLYNNLVPGLVQQTEPPPQNNLRGMVHYQGDDLLAYAEIRHGPLGIWVQPIIHPDTEDVGARLVKLLQNLPGRRSRPVYLCIRSYQAWLEPTVEELGAKPGPRQAVMVKHLAITHRVTQSYVLPALNGTHPEPTVPIAQIEKS